MKPVLKIITKLEKKEFKKGINEMKKDAIEVNEELNAGETATSGMASGLMASAGAMVKLALIIGAIVLAVKGISEAVKSVVENNQELSNKIEAIKLSLSNLLGALTNALGQLIKPIIEWLVNAIYNLMGYINAITQAWFGFSIFTNNAAKNLKETNKQANALKKTLAGFDTANILNKNGTTGLANNEDTQQVITFPEVEIPGWLQWVIDNKQKIIEPFTKIAGGIGDMIGKIKQFVGGNYFQMVWNNANLPLTNLGKSIKNIGTFLSNTWNSMKNTFNNIKNGFIGLKTTLAGVIDGIFGKGTAQKLSNTFWAVFKAGFNSMMATVEKVLNGPIDLINKLVDLYNKLPGIGKKKMEKFSTFKLPRLAKGGIVNNPGAGVVMGSYVAGERGAEAVIPLTDDTLQRLASMIPINIDMTNKLDSRVISRQLVEIQNNKQFARNGG